MHQGAVGEGRVRRRDLVGGPDDGALGLAAEAAHDRHGLAATVAQRRRGDRAAERIEDHQLDVRDDVGRQIAELERGSKLGECDRRRGDHGGA
jgi:hypothetical protein